MAVAFVQSAVPALSRTAAPPSLLRGSSTSGGYAAGIDTSFSAPSMLAFAAVSTGLLGAAGSRQKGRRSSKHNIVECRAMPSQGEVPSKEDVAAAKKKADLLMWAAKTLQGQPQAAEMQAKAEAKMHIYESLKAAFEQGAPAAPAAAAAPPAAAAPAAAVPQPTAQSAGGNVPSKEEVAAAKKEADLAVWAAKTLQGQPQAADMQAKAEAKLNIYESLKAAFEQGAPAAPAAAAAPPAAAVPQPAAQSVGGGVPSKEEVAEAKKKADLIAWAAKTLSAKGSPEAAAMQARATRKVQEYESLKSAFEQGTPAAPVAAAPPAAAPAAAAPPPAAAAPAAPASGTKPSPEELAQFKKEADLMVWAANSLSAKGAPQAAEMQAKAQQKVATYESLKALAMA